MGVTDHESAATPTITLVSASATASLSADPAAIPGSPVLTTNGVAFDIVGANFQLDLTANGIADGDVVPIECIGADGFPVAFAFDGAVGLSASFTADFSDDPPPPPVAAVPEFLITIGTDGVITIPAGDTSGATPQVSFDSAGTVTLATTLDETAGVFTMTLPPGLPTPGVGLMFVCLDDDGNTVPFLPNGLTDPVTSFTVPFFRAPPACLARPVSHVLLGVCKSSWAAWGAHSFLMHEQTMRFFCM